MWRVLFFTLILFSSFAVSQSQEKPKAIKFDEFSSKISGDVKVRLWHLQNELEKQPSSNGIIITFERFIDSKKTKPLQQVVQRQFEFLQLDENKIKIVEGGYRPDYSVELWIVPKDAELPKPKYSTIKFDEFGRLSEKNWKLRLDKFRDKISCGSPETFYVIVYAPNDINATNAAKKYAQFLINKFMCYDPPKIVINGGGIRKNQKTELWIGLSNAESPITLNQ